MAGCNVADSSPSAYIIVCLPFGSLGTGEKAPLAARNLQQNKQPIIKKLLNLRTHALKVFYTRGMVG